MAGDHTEEAPIDALAPPVRAVITAAADVIASRPAANVAAEQLLATAGGIYEVLHLLRTVGPLRVAVARRTPVAVPAGSHSEADRMAVALVGADESAASGACSWVEQRLDAYRRRARRERDAAHRAARGDPVERAEQRQAARLAEARAARDRARAQAAAYQQDARELRGQVAALDAESSALAAHVSTLRAELDSIRALLADPYRLAGRLASLLDALPRTSRDDPRVVQTGEPPRVYPGRAVRNPTYDVSERLREAVRRTQPRESVTDDAGWLVSILRGLATPPPARTQYAIDQQLTVSVLGGGRAIGGSCVLVTAGGTRLLVDAGCRPGGTDESSIAPPRIAEALVEPLDAIVVTHAHNDHGGWVPAVLRRSPGTPVLATPATCELLVTMWLDAEKVLVRRASMAEPEEWTGGPVPPYGRHEVLHAIEKLTPIEFKRPHRVRDLSVELFPAGHIVGAAGVVITAGERRVVISGDVSGPGQLSVGGLSLPDVAIGADVLLLESTYAGQPRPAPRTLMVDEFVRHVSDVLGAGGRVLVPAFALGRAQEVTLLLARHLPGAPVLVDGLARDICEVYERHFDPAGNPIEIFGANVRPVERGRTWMEANRLDTGVVITTSGMLASGPAVTWARAILPDARSALMIVGHQDQQAPGYRLLRLAERGMFDLPTANGSPSPVRVAANVSAYQLGAHASEDELTTIAARVRPGSVMLVHGTPNGQAALARRLDVRGQRMSSADRRWTPGGD